MPHVVQPPSLPSGGTRPTDRRTTRTARIGPTAARSRCGRSPLLDKTEPTRVRSAGGQRQLGNRGAGGLPWHHGGSARRKCTEEVHGGSARRKCARRGFRVRRSRSRPSPSSSASVRPSWLSRCRRTEGPLRTRRSMCRTALASFRPKSSFGLPYPEMLARQRRLD